MLTSMPRLVIDRRLPRVSGIVTTALLTVCLGGLAAPALAQGTVPQPPVRDKAFWRAVMTNDVKAPADVPLPVLLNELSARLGSPDPEWRDDIAYSVLANWIYRQRIVPEDERRRLLRSWQDNLTIGIGQRDDDTVLLRSFSALSLGVLAILDNETPYLDRETFNGLLGASLAYLRDEQDVRGFDARLGWLHSVAHTADLLKFLARSRHLQPQEQAAILNAIAAKLTVVVTPLVHGEDERLARAVLSIVSRTDFDEAGFAAWLKAMAVRPQAGVPTLATLAAGQNRKDVLVSLFAVLSTDRRDLAGVARARALVLETLKGFM